MGLPITVDETGIFLFRVIDDLMCSSHIFLQIIFARESEYLEGYNLGKLKTVPTFANYVKHICCTVRSTTN